MSAYEKMITAAMKGLNLDVDGMKAEITKRIAQFEDNVKKLVDTLAAVFNRLSAIEADNKLLHAKMDALLQHHGISIPAATEQKALTNGTRNPDIAAA